MVPYPPAGGADTTARIVFAQSAPCSASNSSSRTAAAPAAPSAKPWSPRPTRDGYTILYDATAFSVNPPLYPNLTFDYRKDFDPVFLVSLVPNILVVTPSLPAKTMADVIAFAKAAPDGINLASSGNGTLQHLSLEMFRHQTGVKISHVPYRGGGSRSTT